MGTVTDPSPGSINSHYAFITHSQDTLPRNLPPDIDNATLARRRRRRTSPRDQAILEEEYRKCDRPDKIRRKEITRMVQMGEKEVQIWFQNRRQSVKRRSMPLSQNEIFPEANAPMSSQSLPSDPVCVEKSTLTESKTGAVGWSSSPGSAGSSVVSAANSVTTADSSSPSRVPAHSSPTQPTLKHNLPKQNSNSLSLPSQTQQGPVLSARPPPTRPVSSQPSVAESAHGAPALPPTADQQGPPAVVSIQETKMTTSAHNRLQDVLSRVPAPNVASSRRTAPSIAQPAPPRLLKRSSSVRLSTSEGKAIVVLDDPPLSSPPHPTLQPIQQPTPSHLAPRPRKRKLVDSKIWEIACDNQAAIRSPGDTPAEATHALRLIRTKSNNTRLNRLVDSSETPTKKSTTVEKRPKKLSPRTPNEKTKTPRKVLTNNSARPKPVSSKKLSQQQPPQGEKFSFFEPSQDSDKENRPPGAPVSPPPEPKRRPGISGKGMISPGSSKKPRTAQRSPRKILGESKTVPSQSGSASVFYNIPQPRLGVDVYEEPPATQDSGYVASQESVEVENSQTSDFGAPPPSGSQTSVGEDRRVDDLECVSNLLSLSKGSWK